MIFHKAGVPLLSFACFGRRRRFLQRFSYLGGGKRFLKASGFSVSIVRKKKSSFGQIDRRERLLAPFRRGFLGSLGRKKNSPYGFPFFSAFSEKNRRSLEKSRLLRGSGFSESIERKKKTSLGQIDRGRKSLLVSFRSKPRFSWKPR